LVFFITSTIHHALFPLQIWVYGNQGYLIALALNVVFYATCYFTSNSFKYNSETAKRNGFSTSNIYSFVIINLFIWHLPFYLLIWAFAPYDPSMIRFDYLIIVELVIALVTADILFFFVHRGLHRHMPKLHSFHHCSKYSSMLTNLFFHPIDLIIELGTPLLWATLLYVYIFNDIFGMVITYSVFLTWYGLDHDEYARLPHWQHHKLTNTIYPAYANYKEFDVHDGVKKLVNN